MHVSIYLSRVNLNFGHLVHLNGRLIVARCVDLPLKMDANVGPVVELDALLRDERNVARDEPH